MVSHGRRSKLGNVNLLSDPEGCPCRKKEIKNRSHAFKLYERQYFVLCSSLHTSHFREVPRKSDK